MKEDAVGVVDTSVDEVEAEEDGVLSQAGTKRRRTDELAASGRAPKRKSWWLQFDCYLSELYKKNGERLDSDRWKKYVIYLLHLVLIR